MKYIIFRIALSCFFRHHHSQNTMGRSAISGWCRRTPLHQQRRSLFLFVGMILAVSNHVNALLLLGRRWPKQSHAPRSSSSSVLVLFTFTSTTCRRSVALASTSTARASSTTNTTNDTDNEKTRKIKTVPPSHAYQTIRNPWTGRMIQQTPFMDHNSSSLTTKSIWQTHFLSPGGWVAHGGHACPLFPQSQNNNTTSTTTLKDDTWWYTLHPQYVSVSDKTICPIPMDQLPRMDELLWVSKPVNLLTLPGKGEPDALSSQVERYLQEQQGQQQSSSSFPISAGGGGDPQRGTTHQSPRHTKRNQNKKTRTKNDGTSTKKPWIPRPCHRLDKDTSGIIVIGLTRDAYKGVSYQFEHRWTHKRYVALVHGLIPDDTGTIDLPIGSLVSHDDKKTSSYKTWSTSPLAEKPREAITHWEVSHRYTNSDSSRSRSTTTTRTKRRSSGNHQQSYHAADFQDYTRVILYPKTGRGHQLRLHMAEGLGHEILGDSLHGTSSGGDVAPRLCLHAEYLELWARDDRDAIYKVQCWNVPPF